MGNPTKQFRTAAAAVICLTLTAGAAGGQTREETELDVDGRDPRYITDEQVCPWDQVTANPDLAAECLRLAEVNEGLAEYAFTRPPTGDVPEPVGTEAAAGEVPRWAMAEALTRVLTAGGATLPETDREGRIVEPIARGADYPDIGWLTPQRQTPIYQLRNTRPVKIAEGFRDGGFGAHQPVDRWQMALFFVRTLRVIDHADPENIPSLDIEAIWQNLLETPIDRVSMPFPDREVADWKTFGYSHERYRAVSLLYELGITFGDERGEYRPYDRVTGPQMALFLVRLLAHTNVRAGAGTETPAIQPPEVIVPTERNGSRPSDTYPEGYEFPAIGTPLADIGQDDPATRAPREIDYFRYRTDLTPTPDNEELWASYNINDGNPRPMRLTRPFSLQPGDWYWTGPEGYEYRGIVVLVELQTSGSYHPTIWPFIRAVSCVWTDDPSRGEYFAHHLLKYAAGLYQLTAKGDWDGDLRIGGRPCDMGDHTEVPRPAGGYTEKYPCDGTSQAVTSRFARQGFDLKPCGT